MEKSQSVRIANTTYKRVNVIARREQRTITTVIDRAVQLYEQESRRQIAHRKGEQTP